MGLAYSAARALWWVGPADSGHGEVIQDDEAVIAGAVNGFGYRPDHFGQTLATATPLTVFNGQVGEAGVIDTPNSADCFSFSTTGGAASFTLATAAVCPTLHARLELWSSAGIIAVGDSPTALGASISATLAAGKYYVVVRSHGGYGDVGQYTLSALVPQATNGGPSLFTRAATFTLTSDHALWAADAAGNWRELSPAGTILAINTSTDAAGHPEVFALASDHSLWVNIPAGWVLLSPAGTINALAASPGNVVFALASNASLWRYNVLGWVELSPAGTILSVSAGADAAGAPEAFVRASDHSYWMYNRYGWSQTTAAVVQASGAPVAAKPVSTQQAALAQDAGSRQAAAAVPVHVTVNTLVPHEPFMPMCMCPACVAARLAAQRH
jgi:hypothetical protein